MKWLLWTVAVFAAALAAVFLVGLVLPRTHRASRMARFKQSPEALFAAIINRREWQPEIEWQDIPSGNGLRRWRENSRHGSVTYEEVEAVPPRLYKVRIADEDLPFGGTWTWEITPTADGSTCRITEDGEVYNPIFRFVGRLMIGYTKTIETNLGALGKKFNEQVTIED